MGRFAFCLAAICAWVLSTSDAQAISSGEVMKNFNSQYQLPAGRKLISSKYIGGMRNFTMPEGLIRVPSTAYKVQVVNLFEDCGLKVKYTWEAFYRKGKTFTQIAILKHEIVGKAPKAPKLDALMAEDLIKEHWIKAAGQDVTTVVSAKVTGQTQVNQFCDTSYEVRATVKLATGPMTSPKRTLYECPAVATIVEGKKGVSVSTNDCLDKSGKKHRCFYKTSCKDLGTKLFTPPIDKASAAKNIEARLKDHTNNLTPAIPRKAYSVSDVIVISVGDSADPLVKTAVATFVVHAKNIYADIYLPDPKTCMKSPPRGQNSKTLPGAAFQCAARFGMKYDPVVYKTWVARTMNNCSPDAKVCSDTLRDLRAPYVCQSLLTEGTKEYHTNLMLKQSCDKALCKITRVSSGCQDWEPREKIRKELGMAVASGTGASSVAAAPVIPTAAIVATGGPAATGLSTQVKKVAGGTGECTGKIRGAQVAACNACVSKGAVYSAYADKYNKEGHCAPAVLPPLFLARTVLVTRSTECGRLAAVTSRVEQCRACVAKKGTYLHSVRKGGHGYCSPLPAEAEWIRSSSMNCYKWIGEKAALSRCTACVQKKGTYYRSAAKGWGWCRPQVATGLDFSLVSQTECDVMFKGEAQHAGCSACVAQGSYWSKIAGKAAAWCAKAP